MCMLFLSGCCYRNGCLKETETSQSPSFCIFSVGSAGEPCSVGRALFHLIGLQGCCTRLSTSQGHSQGSDVLCCLQRCCGCCVGWHFWLAWPVQGEEGGRETRVLRLFGGSISLQGPLGKVALLPLAQGPGQPLLPIYGLVLLR